jgi:hypothetical protein
VDDDELVPVVDDGVAIRKPDIGFFIGLSISGIILSMGGDDDGSSSIIGFCCCCCLSSCVPCFIAFRKRFLGAACDDDDEHDDDVDCVAGDGCIPLFII